MTLSPGWFLNATGQFTPVVGGTSTTSGFMTILTKSTTADITLNSTSTFFDGAAVSQGSSGIWYVTATMLGFEGGAGASYFWAKLHDGTSVIASGVCSVGVSFPGSVSLSGVISNPAGNLRISMLPGRASSTALFNYTGFSRDCTITAIRIG